MPKAPIVRVGEESRGVEVGAGAGAGARRLKLGANGALLRCGTRPSCSGPSGSVYHAGIIGSSMAPSLEL